MIDFKKLRSIEQYICKSTRILEEDCTDELIEYFIAGYSDLITSKIINEFGSQVIQIRSLEEFAYLEGYSVANFDYKLKMYTTNFDEYRTIYKETIKDSLMVAFLPDSVNVLTSWIMHLEEISK